MESDLPARLLTEARQLTASRIEQSRLMPFRETLLTLRAKRISYERIATMLKGHGVVIQSSTVGYFCRRYCPAPEIERVRRELIVAATGVPAPVSPAAPSLVKPVPTPAAGKRRNARIARDDL